MRASCISLVCVVALGLVVAGCGGGEEQPELASTTQASDPIETTSSGPRLAAEPHDAVTTPARVSSVPLPGRQRRQIARRAADTARALERWDQEFATCIEGGDRGSTCTHAAWERLVFQVEIAMYYLLDELRGMPRGGCHDALAVENDLLRGFWHGAAPLNLAWLDEQQRPPSRFDLESAVDLIRPVPERIREVVATVCA